MKTGSILLKGVTGLRGCTFEYAGINSQEFEMVLAFVGKPEDTLDSGGLYELLTDYTPTNSEALLYGKKFEQPLEFEVDIMRLEGEFSPQEMAKVKEWLFGQDGWKTFKYLGEGYEDYHLKCLFIPEETYIGNDGFTGLRCKLSNISPYWYKDEILLTSTNGIDFTTSTGNNLKYGELDIPNEHFIENIYPTITLTLDSTLSLWDDLIIGTTTQYNQWYKTGYLIHSRGLNNTTNNRNVIQIDTKYSIARRRLYSSNVFIETVPIEPIDGITSLTLNKNNPVLCIKDETTASNAQYVDASLSYTPMVRLGAL